MKDIVIIGAGQAGLAAALYGARSGMDLAVIDSNYMGGGQVLTTYEVDNYLGIPGINGFDMGMKFQEHVAKFGVEILSYKVESIEHVKEQTGDNEEPSAPYFVVHTEQGEIKSKTVLLATGAVNRKLEIPGEEEFRGRGVGYCATCDGAFYRGKVTAVVGGSYQAVEDAIYLAGLCEKVYLIHRRDKLRAGAVLEEQVKKLTNVEIVWDSIPLEISGERAVDTLLIKNVKTEEMQGLKVDGVFVAIGTKPSTALAEGLVEMDEQGYVIDGENVETYLA